MRPWQKNASICAGFGAAVGLLVVAAAGTPASAQDQASRAFSISGNQYAFHPASVTVERNDLVKITFKAEDIAHSFTIDSYRISKRAGAGQSVTFEFRADQPGSFDYYCNLSIDSKCKTMKGKLIVK
ncbi:MAG TPA: cupredoxin domain-containing protein [Vicinamibacterales bacterium]|jgi:plastocyanin